MQQRYSSCLKMYAKYVFARSLFFIYKLLSGHVLVSFRPTRFSSYGGQVKTLQTLKTKELYALNQGTGGFCHVLNAFFDDLPQPVSHSFHYPAIKLAMPLVLENCSKIIFRNTVIGMAIIKPGIPNI